MRIVYRNLFKHRHTASMSAERGRLTRGSGVKAIILKDDHRPRLTRVRTTAGHGPDLASPHQEESEIASMNA
jgi:hypothetical protein